jgi:predicted deacetylase
MSYRFRLGVPVGVVALTAACGGEPNSGTPCPEPSGEFPPTHCAYAKGRLTAAGAPVAGAGLRVDDFVPPVGYAYASSAAATDALGRFTLLVFRVNEFQAPSVPDTATVYVKLYPSAAAAERRAATADSLAVRMTFAPMGTPVDTTEIELILP